MTQIATVEKLLSGGMAEISVARQSACAHDCHECAGCGGTPAPVRAAAKNPIGAQVGQKVIVESSSRDFFAMALLVYMVPVALFFLGYFLSYALPKEGLRYLIAIVGFCVGVAAAVRYDRHVRAAGGLAFTIVRVF